MIILRQSLKKMLTKQKSYSRITIVDAVSAALAGMAELADAQASGACSIRLE